MIKTNCDKILFCYKNYVKENWGSPFLVGFLFFLVGAAISLSLGLLSLADSLAVYSFYVLVIGVVLQFACFLKYGEKGEAEVHQ